MFRVLIDNIVFSRLREYSPRYVLSIVVTNINTISIMLENIAASEKARSHRIEEILRALYLRMFWPDLRKEYR